MENQQLRTNNESINLFDVFLICLKRKRLIVLGSAVSAMIFLAACLIMTPSYRAVTAIMPPTSSGASTVGALLGQFAGIAGVSAGLPTTTTSGLYMGLLQSQGILDTIIAEYDVMKREKLRTIEEARDFLIKSVLLVDIDMNSGIIKVSADDKDPKRSADMANAFARELKRVFDTLATTEAGKRRIFFEAQIKKTQQDLIKAEVELRNFAENTGAIRIDEQTSAVLQTILALRNTIAAKEVQLQVLQTFAAKNNPDMKRAEKELAVLRNQLKELEAKEEPISSGSLIPTTEVPSLGMEYLRKYRDFKYQEILHELLVKQYEAARLEEAKESSPVQVIHEALVPTRPATPKTILVTLFAGMVGFFLCTMMAFCIELYRAGSRRADFQERFRQLHHFLSRI
jgi:tyrosine-protein kinase Etk/Wzc